MKRKRRPGSLLLVAAAFVLIAGSCMKKEDFGELEKQNIRNYIEKNPDMTFSLKESGLYYREVATGSGDGLRTHDTAYVIYTGKFLDGYVFDTNVGKDTLGFAVGENQWVIPGFDEGISYMKEGGQSMFIIPSNLAYGPFGYGMIGGYTPLLYEVKLGRISRGPGK